MKGRIPRPSGAELRRLAKENHFTLTDEEVAIYGPIIDSALSTLESLERLTPATSPRSSRRPTGRPPSAASNQLGAWAWRCSIRGRRRGALAGKTVVVKDNIAVAGVPSHNGSLVFSNYTPGVDASVVTRVLAAGGRIVGKATCENMCFSGGSHTSYPQPVKNPVDPRYMAGGSSSGCAVLVANGEVDLAIGGDQAGSIRIPSAWCGILGMKPTWGLVPYAGAIPMEFTIDHLGPMARSAEDLALLLDALAGRDGLDPRQGETPVRVQRSAPTLKDGIRGLRIGILEEGFGWKKVSDAEVDEVVLEGAESLRKEGAELRRVSVPMHREGRAIWSAIGSEGTWALMQRGHGMGYGWKGRYDAQLEEFLDGALKSRGDHMPPIAKIQMIVGELVGTTQNGRFYALGRELGDRLASAYDDALDEFDALLLPTTPVKPGLLRKGGVAEMVEDAGDEAILNTCPFDVTGHPAVTVPCGFAGGLPVGMMLVARRFSEATLARMAYAFERGAPERR